MGDNDDKPAPLRRYRSRVITGDGHELVSDVAHVRLPQVEPEEARVKVYELRKILVAVEGATQKAFRSDDFVDHPFQFVALQLEFAARRQPNSDKRLPQPVRIAREVGRSSPQIWQALAVGESLPSVRVGCYGVEKNAGEPEVEFFGLKLTDAHVVGAELQVPKPSRADSRNLPMVQAISFSYRQAEWKWLDGDITALDQV